MDEILNDTKACNSVASGEFHDAEVHFLAGFVSHLLEISGSIVDGLDDDFFKAR